MVYWILCHLLAAYPSDIMVSIYTFLEEKSFWLQIFFLSIFMYHIWTSSGKKSLFPSEISVLIRDFLFNK